MNNQNTDKFSYLSIKEISEITGINYRSLTRYCKNGRYYFRKVHAKGGKTGLKYEILISSLEPELQNKIFFNYKQGAENKDQLPAPFSLGLPIIHSVFHSGLPFLPTGAADSETCGSSISLKKPVPKSAKDIALTKFNIVDLWLKYRNDKEDKDKADKEFILGVNNQIIYKDAFETIGKISKPTLYRWKKILQENNNDYLCLINNYKYSSDLKLNTSLTDEEKQEFINIYYNDSKMNLKTVYNLIKFKKTQTGEVMKSYATYKRFADFVKRYHYDFEVLSREGEKTLKDKVIPSIRRDISTLKTGDVFVADGNKLDFMIINPFTGKPARAIMVVFQDWYSRDFAGYEIMFSENTQCISSALRNAILRLGKFPKVVYMDNGRAFRGKYFTGCDNFDRCNFKGIYANLGIKTIFAKPYNGKAKIIERSFGDFVKSCPPLVSSYIGSSIAKQPAHLKRNEKFHKEIHKNDKIPTLEQAKFIIDSWLKYYRQQPWVQDKSKTIGEVFNEGIGSGIDKEMLDELMMQAEERTVKRCTIKLLGQEYTSEKLYGIQGIVVVKYSLFDVSSIKVYSKKGDFICEANTVIKYNPMAKYFGTASDRYSLRQAQKQQNALEMKTKKNTKLLQGKSYVSFDNLPSLQEEQTPQIEDTKKRNFKKYEILGYEHFHKYIYNTPEKSSGCI